MYYFIYLIFGTKIETESELIYSLLSLQRVANNWTKKNVKTLIYAENPLHFPENLNSLNLEVIYLSSKQLKQWRKAANGFNLSLKIRVINHFLKNYKSTGIFVDTDTFFLKDPSSLFQKVDQGFLLLHLKEYQLVNQPYIHSYLSQKIFKSFNGKKYQIDGCNDMWNSGVVGISPQYLKLMPDIISLIENITKDKNGKQGWHIMEQLAFSYFFQKEQIIYPTDHIIGHYWFYKRFRFFLAHYLGYYHGNDNNSFNILMEENSELFAKNTFSSNDLVTLLSKLVIKEFSVFPTILLNCIPSSSITGEKIRKVIDSYSSI